MQTFKCTSAKYKASSVWCFYSMLRTSIQTNHNVDINYPKLQTFLKKASVGYRAKKSKGFQPSEIRNFLCNAPDKEFLAAKVTFFMCFLASVTIYPFCRS